MYEPKTQVWGAPALQHWSATMPMQSNTKLTPLVAPVGAGGVGGAGVVVVGGAGGAAGVVVTGVPVAGTGGWARAATQAWRLLKATA